MSDAFLITGLPRSRTAWMSVAAGSVDFAICYHEPICWVAKWRDAFELWDDPKYDFVGISDSGLGFRLQEIIDRFDPQILIIDRPVSDVEASFSRLEGHLTNYARLLSRELEPFAPSAAIKRVAYDRLRDDAVIVDCLEHLMPGAQIDVTKIHELQRIDIQADMDVIRGAVKDRVAEITDLLGPKIMAEHATIEVETV